MGKKKRKSESPRKKPSRNARTDVRGDILRAVETAFPDGIVEMPWRDDEDEYIRDELYDRLRTAFRKFRDANILLEIPEEEFPDWREYDSDLPPMADLSPLSVQPSPPDVRPPRCVAGETTIAVLPMRRA